MKVAYASNDGRFKMVYFPSVQHVMHGISKLPLRMVATPPVITRASQGWKLDGGSARFLPMGVTVNPEVHRAPKPNRIRAQTPLPAPGL